MKTSAVAVIKSIAYKPNNPNPSVKLSLICGKDPHEKTVYINAICSTRLDKTDGIYDVENKLKLAQSSKPDNTILCDVEILNLKQEHSDCKRFINNFGYLISIKARDSK